MEKVQKYIEDHNKIVWLSVTVILCVAAFLEYYCRWRWNTSFVNDEFQSVTTAINLSKGNGFIKNDRLGEGIASYTRGWPATVLLAGWIKLFGISETACRSLSTVYGTLAVLSTVYITRKMFKDLGYSVLVSLLFIAEPVCGLYFAQCRMYSLEILCVIWLYYFIYCALNGKSSWKSEACSGKKELLREYLDLHWGYVTASLVLLVLCFEIHVNSAIPLGGVVCYVMVQAIRGRKKKYVLLAGMVIAGGIICLVNYLFYLVTGNFIIMQHVFGQLAYYAASINIQLDYLIYILETTGALVVSVICFFLIAITWIKQKQLDDKIIYLLCLVVFTVIFFVLFSSGRYTFRDRYIVMLVPLAMALFAYAYLILKKWNRFVAYVVLTGMIWYTGSSIKNDVYFRMTTENACNTDFITAYSKIGEYYDLEAEQIPIVQSYMRSYYSEQVLQNIVYTIIDRENDFDIWKDFAREYPEGIITVEQIKLNYLKQSVPLMVQNWTDRLSGPGVDNTYVNVSHYNFLYECNDRMDENIKEVLYSDNTNNLKSYFKGDKLWISVPRSVLERENAPADPEVIFIDVCFDVSGDNVQRYFQLCLPEDISRMDHFVYEIDVKQMRNISTDDITGAMIDQSRMAVYGNDYLQEYFIDETTGDNNNHTAL